MRHLTIFTLIVVTLSGCYTSREYDYSLNQETKDLIKKVFTTGDVSCTDGYCWTIVNETSEKNSYSIQGSRVLFMKIDLKATQKTNSENVKVGIKVKNLGLRLKKIEKSFLEELGYNLFLQNKEATKQTIKTILEKEGKKSKNRVDSNSN